jgi:hypothetical protein
MDEGRPVVDRTRTATERYAAEVQKLDELLATGAIDQQTYSGRSRTRTTGRCARAKPGSTIK